MINENSVTAIHQGQKIKAKSSSESSTGASYFCSSPPSLSYCLSLPSVHLCRRAKNSHDSRSAMAEAFADIYSGKQDTPEVSIGP